MSFSQQRPRGVALAKDPSERGLRGPFLVQGGGKRRLAGIFDPFQGFDWCAVIQKVSCPDDGAGGDSRRGEPYENITHHSFNSGTDDRSFNSGTDDRCRSVAHNACQRLGLGLARRMGMGRCRAGTRNGSSSWQRARCEFILRLRLPDGYGTGFGYAPNSYLRPIATAARLTGYAYGTGYGSPVYGGYRYAYHPHCLPPCLRRRSWRPA